MDEPEVFSELDKKNGQLLWLSFSDPVCWWENVLTHGCRSRGYSCVAPRWAEGKLNVAETWSRAHRSSGRAKGSSSNETKTHEQSQEQFCASSSVAQSDLWLEPSSTPFWRDLIMAVFQWSRSLLTEPSSTRVKGQNNYVTAICDLKFIIKTILTETMMQRCIAVLDVVPENSYDENCFCPSEVWVKSYMAHQHPRSTVNNSAGC